MGKIIQLFIYNYFESLVLSLQKDGYELLVTYLFIEQYDSEFMKHLFLCLKCRLSRTIAVISVPQPARDYKQDVQLPSPMKPLEAVMKPLSQLYPARAASC